MVTTVQNSIYFWLALIGLVAFLAVLPTLIALARGVDDIAIIMLFNAICCTTVIGWPVALILATRWPRRDLHPSPPPWRSPPAPPLDHFRSRLQDRGPDA